MRLSAATLSTRLSLLALGAIAVVAVSDTQPSLGDEPLRLAQARIKTSQAVPAAEIPLPLPKPGRSTTKPDPSWPKTLPEAKAEAEAATKPPDVWSDQEIADAKAHCAKVLRGVAAVIVPAEPIKSGACGTPAPVELVSIGSNPEIAVSPPAKLTCDMVATLAEWFKQDVQPLARLHFGEDVIRISTMSSYSCRNAYGRKRTRLSEHGLANALDLGSFVTDKGTEIDLLANWGPTERDIRAAIAAALKAEEKRAAEAKRAAEEKAKTAPKAPAGVAITPPDPKPGDTKNVASTHPPVALERQTPLPDRLGFRQSTLIDGIPPPRRPSERTKSKPAAALEKPSNLGHPLPAGSPKPLVPQIDKKGEFLRSLHSAACKRFGTVLGPEANEAHRNHFHLDMAERRRGNYCE